MKRKKISTVDMNERKFRLFNKFFSDQIFLLGERGELLRRLRSEAAEVEGWVLRYESSTLILLKELSSTIFQSLSVRQGCVTPV